MANDYQKRARKAYFELPLYFYPLSLALLWFIIFNNSSYMTTYVKKLNAKFGITPNCAAEKKTCWSEIKSIEDFWESLLEDGEVIQY